MIRFDSFNTPVSEFVPYEDSHANIANIMDGRPFVSFGAVATGEVHLEDLDIEAIDPKFCRIRDAPGVPYVEFVNFEDAGEFTEQLTDVAAYITDVESEIRGRASASIVLRWRISRGLYPIPNSTDLPPHLDWSGEKYKKRTAPRIATWIVSDKLPTENYEQDYPAIPWRKPGNWLKRKLGLDERATGSNTIVDQHIIKHTNLAGGVIGRECVLYRLQGVHRRQAETDRTSRTRLMFYTSDN